MGSPEAGHTCYGSSSFSIGLIVKLVSRCLIIACTFICLLVLTSNASNDNDSRLAHHKVMYASSDVFSSRYMLFAALLGLVYSLLQTAVSIFQLNSRNGVRSSLVLLDFYGDLLILYALATGAVAGSGASVDLKRMVEGNVLNNLFDKSNAAASFLFLGSICSAISMASSAFDPTKRFYSLFRRCEIV